MGEDHRQVLKQALSEMLNLPLKQLVEKNYPDFEMRPDAWSISVIIQRYIVPKRQDLTTSDKFFDDLETPEAKQALRAWLQQINRETPMSLGSTRPRNTVEDYLNGAEEQCECEFQGAAIRQAFVDMLHEPVESLRKKRYWDDESDSHKCTITQLLNHHFVPDSYADFDKDEFFRDVKKPEAQEIIQKWLDHIDHPDGNNSPEREEQRYLIFIVRFLRC